MQVDISGATFCFSYILTDLKLLEWDWLHQREIKGHRAIFICFIHWLKLVRSSYGDINLFIERTTTGHCWKICCPSLRAYTLDSHSIGHPDTCVHQLSSPMKCRFYCRSCCLLNFRGALTTLSKDSVSIRLIFNWNFALQLISYIQQVSANIIFYSSCLGAWNGDWKASNDHLDCSLWPNLVTKPRGSPICLVFSKRLRILDVYAWQRHRHH